MLGRPNSGAGAAASFPSAGATTQAPGRARPAREDLLLLAGERGPVHPAPPLLLLLQGSLASSQISNCLLRRRSAAVECLFAASIVGGGAS
jgi:hypothetical protein